MGLLGTLLGVAALPAAAIPGAGPFISAGLKAGSALANGASGSKNAKRAAEMMAAASERAAADILGESERGSTDILGAGSNAAGDMEYQGDLAAQLISGAANQGVSRVDDAASALNPYISGGTDALNRVLAGIANGGEFAQKFTGQDFMNDPGLQFRIAKGTQALEGSATARGLFSGNDAKAIQGYGQQQASDEYDRAFNRFMTSRQAILDPLMSIADAGRAATGQKIGAAGTAANILSGAAGDISSSRLNAQQAAGGFRANAATNAANLRADARRGASAYSTDAATARAGGQIGSANQWLAAQRGVIDSLSDIGASDWSKIFKRKSTGPPAGYIDDGAGY